MKSQHPQTRNLNTVQTVLSQDAVNRLESILYWFWNEPPNSGRNLTDIAERGYLHREETTGGKSRGEEKRRPDRNAATSTMPANSEKNASDPTETDTGQSRKEETHPPDTRRQK